MAEEKRSSFSCAQIPVLTLLGRQNRLPAVDNLEMLKSSILQYGLCVPLLVSRSMQILSGTEMFLAACAVGFSTVPVLIAPELPLRMRRQIKALHEEQLVCAEWDTIAAALDDTRTADNGRQV